MRFMYSFEMEKSELHETASRSEATQQVYACNGTVKSDGSRCIHTTGIIWLQETQCARIKREVLNAVHQPALIGLHMK